MGKKIYLWFEDIVDKHNPIKFNDNNNNNNSNSNKNNNLLHE